MKVIAALLLLMASASAGAVSLTWEYDHPEITGVSFRLVCNEQTIWTGTETTVSIDYLIAKGINACRVYAVAEGLESGPSNEARFLYPSPDSLQVVF